MQPRRRIAKRIRIRTRIQLLPQGLCEIYYCSGGIDFSHMARACVGKEGSVWVFIIIYGRTQHVLFTGIWRRVYGKQLLSKRGNPLPPLHGLHFPIRCLRINRRICAIFRCIRSNIIFGGLIYQGGNTKYEGVSKISEKLMLEAVKNCLIRRPKVRITFGLASNNIYLLSNTASSTQTTFMCINV